MNKFYIGFMSGTSLDGLDASLIKTDAKNNITPVLDLHIPYHQSFKNQLKELLHLNIDLNFFDIERELTSLHIEATNKLLSKVHLKNSDIAAIGFHGQTIYHNPEKRVTWQIGDPFMLTADTGIKTIWNFRKNDMAYGGQGAPLIPIFHKAIMANETYPIAVINIGGVANITYIDRDNLIAFDTGPGNALIDDACLEYFDKPYDNNGEIAKTGIVDMVFVNKFLEHEYFYKIYPKSLDRNEFKNIILLKMGNGIINLSESNIISTLTYITAASIALSLKQLPKIPNKIYLCGGGVHNGYLTKLIKDLVNIKYSCEVLNIRGKDGLNPDFIESQGFAYLAARFCNNLPSSFPSTTGARKNVICGAAVNV